MDPEEYVVDRQRIVEAREDAAMGPRAQKSFYLTREIIRRVNAATYWARAKALASGAQPEDLDVPDSASALVESALWGEVKRLEDLYNQGESFPDAPGKLKVGPGSRGADRLRDRASTATPQFRPAGPGAGDQ